MQKRVMVVDDETNIRFVLKRMLEKAGYGVIEARNGNECLDILSRERPDLILLDVMLPRQEYGNGNTCFCVARRSSARH